jgi:hypothetical protein
VPGFQHEGQPLINSEYGGVGALDGDRDVSWTFKFLTNELRRHPQISGYIYTELHDVEWEYNGFLNYDRTPKTSATTPPSSTKATCCPVDAPPRSRVAPGDQVSLDVASSHFLHAAQEERRSCNGAWQASIPGTASGRTSPGAQSRLPFPHYRVAHAHTIELEMPSTTMLCTLHLQAITADGRSSRAISCIISFAPDTRRREELPIAA